MKRKGNNDKLSEVKKHIWDFITVLCGIVWEIVKAILYLIGVVLRLIGKGYWKGLVMMSKGLFIFMAIFIFIYVIGVDKEAMSVFQYIQELSDEFGGMNVWLFICIFGICPAAVLILDWGYERRCPYCKKWFSLKKDGEQLVDSKDINIRTELATKDLRGNKIGTHEQYISGSRNKYRISYVCRHCMEITYKTYSKDVKNV